MLLVIDNYDSFTWNLAQSLGALGGDPIVRRNDEVDVEEIQRLAPERIVISPGPGRPEDAGVSLEVVRRFGRSVPILGVCLGHQSIGLAFGAAVVRGTPVHGKTSRIEHDGRGVFDGVPRPFEAARYHSLVVERGTLPAELEISAETEDGTVMGIRHRQWPVHGVQFHPESVLTIEGQRILQRFLELR